MTATIVGIDPGAHSWGWFACNHSRELSWGVYGMKAMPDYIRVRLAEIDAWLRDWTGACVFVIEAQPAIASHLVTRMEATLCALAYGIPEATLVRRVPKGEKRGRQDMARAYWKLGDLGLPKKKAEHVLDAAWLAMLGDER